MKYFENFPKVQYVLEDNEGRKFPVDVSDIFIRFRILDKINKDPFAYYDYMFVDGDRPDTIADKYYGDPQYAWLVMLSNFFADFQYDFPVTQDILEDNIKAKYNITIEEATQTIIQYEIEDRIVVDEQTFINSTDPNKKALSIYDLEDRNNEDKRVVKLLSKKYLTEINKELRNKLSDIRNARETRRL